MSALVLLAFAGAFSHLLYFRRGEHLRASPMYVVCAATAPILLFSYFLYGRGQSWHQALLQTTVYYWSFMGGLFASMAVYRAFFHPLCAYPGPFWARITQFWLPFNVAERADSAWFIGKLHKKHGDYVRIGPNLLSIADPDMVHPIHATGSQFGKGQWYDVAKPLTTVQQARERPMHDKRRKSAWDPAFTASALRNYDPRILKHANELMNQLHSLAGQAVNATQWMNFFAFDVMGDLAFGRHFNLLETRKPHMYLESVHENGKAFGILGSCSWFLHCAMSLIPERFSPMSRMLLYSREAIEHRKLNEPAVPDIMTSLLKAERFMKSDKEEALLLEGDTRLLIIAGADTTATALSFMVYHLAQNPSLATNLRNELAEHDIFDGESIEIARLARLPYLNALIDETLRLHSPTPGGLHRQPPDEGIRLGNHFIPGGIQVLTPMDAIMRSPRAFVQPEDFIPERWTSKPELVLNKNAFFPFSLSSWACVGKQLAYNELRTVITKLVLGFEIKFAPGESGHDILNKSQDVFTVTCAPLYLVFTPREG